MITIFSVMVAPSVARGPEHSHFTDAQVHWQCIADKLTMIFFLVDLCTWSYLWSLQSTDKVIGFVHFLVSVMCAFSASLFHCVLCSHFCLVFTHDYFPFKIEMCIAGHSGVSGKMLWLWRWSLQWGGFHKEKLADPFTGCSFRNNADTTTNISKKKHNTIASCHCAVVSVQIARWCGLTHAWQCSHGQTTHLGHQLTLLTRSNAVVTLTWEQAQFLS